MYNTMYNPYDVQHLRWCTTLTMYNTYVFVVLKRLRACRGLVDKNVLCRPGIRSQERNYIVRRQKIYLTIIY